MLNIPNIQLKLLCPRDVITPIDLSPAAHPGCHIMATPLGFIIQRQILWQQRPRAYKSHITFQDIDKLWELIDGGGTDNLSDFCQTVSIRQQLAVGIPLVRHCLELNRLENLFVLTRPVLREEDTFETILVGEDKKNDCRNK